MGSDRRRGTGVGELGQHDAQQPPLLPETDARGRVAREALKAMGLAVAARLARVPATTWGGMLLERRSRWA